MKLCSICHKNVAIIYTAKVENDKTDMVGICAQCAKKLGMPIMNQLMQQAGITPEELDNISEQMNTAFQDMDVDDMNDLNQLMVDGGEKDNITDIINANIINPDKSKENNEKIIDKADDAKTDSNAGSGNNMFEGILNNLFSKSNNMKNENNKNNSEGNGFVKTHKGKKKRKYLDTYGINLTKRALNNEVDRVIGRDREIDRVIQILNRRTKNNPVLIGEPGVGKTAIAEGLAVRITDKKVPAKLYDAEVYLLDLTAIVAGTQFRGQFESRMKSLIDEAKDNGNIILVIDELHNIIGAGDVQGGAMNAANILKPALSKGEIQVIGATTLEEYRKHIEKDSALARRFQPVIVDEPSEQETIEILKGIRQYYEEYHQVIIPDEVIASAVKLSERYINDRYLPDKAIDVIDEASSRANLKNLGLVELKSLKQELAVIEEKTKEAAQNTDYEKAAEYKADQCRVEKQIKETEDKCKDVFLTTDDIAAVIEAWTKIPVKSVTEEEAIKLLSLEERLHRRVIGQDKAVEDLSKAIRRNRLGFRKMKKPSSFIFVGPTGVGKTELVKALACELFGSEDALIRIDMSEYMEKHTVSKLIGAPPGYVGYDEGGQLTEKVRRKPYSVILLDEIEKAHPDVFNMLLQILEDGRLTDNQGRTVYFDNTVIIMTSNLGTDFKASGIGFSIEQNKAMESHVKDELRQFFRPEFLNRVDDTIIFKNLSKEELYKIIELMFREVYDEVSENKITIEVTDEVRDFILKNGYDEKYGARPLRRTIQKYIEDEITGQYLEKKFSDGAKLKVAIKDGNIDIEQI